MQKILFIHAGKKYSKLALADIVYIEALKNYVRIVTPGKKYMFRATMAYMDRLLPKNQFCRIHRRYIVALNSVTAFDHNKMQMPGRELPIGDQYWKALLGRIITLEGVSRRSGSRAAALD